LQPAWPTIHGAAAGNQKEERLIAKPPSGVEQRLHRFGAARPDGDLMAALQQIERHRASHDAEANGSDIHAALHEVEAAILAKAASVEYSIRAGKDSCDYSTPRSPLRPRGDVEVPWPMRRNQ
jgi:hypothetical protein